MGTHTTSSGSAERPLRADARRNRTKLLAVAAEMFAAEGTAASLDEIAKRAEVGPGTLYRHFPTRQDLLVALLRERVDTLTAQATQLLTNPSPQEALRTWLELVALHSTTYRGLPSELNMAEASQPADVLAACHQAMHRAGAALVDRAMRAGVLRTDVTVSEILQLTNAVAWASEQNTASPQGPGRLLDLLLQGLLPRP
nr:TetR/AcrR family transcriptional regulator [Dactylosporangium thailandense]